MSLLRKDMRETIKRTKSMTGSHHIQPSVMLDPLYNPMINAPVDGDPNDAAHATAPCGDFDILFWPVFSRNMHHLHPARAVWCALFGDHGHPMLIGAWNPMLCPNWGCRASHFITSNDVLAVHKDLIEKRKSDRLKSIKQKESSMRRRAAAAAPKSEFMSQGEVSL